MSDTIIRKKGTGLNLKEAAKKGLPSKKRHCQTTQNTMRFTYEDTNTFLYVHLIKKPEDCVVFV